MFQAVDRDLMVQIVRHRRDDGVHLAGIDHFLPVLEEREFGVFFLAHLLLFGVDVAQRAKLHMLRLRGRGHAGHAAAAGEEAGIRAALGADADDA